MLRHLLLVSFLIISLDSPANQDSEDILRAAHQLRSNAVWDPASILKVDFDCDGKADPIVLGKTTADAIVLIFNKGLYRKPIELAFSFAPYGERSMKLYVEDLNMSDEAIDMFLASGHGYRRSKSCKGLYLYDGERDGLHMYWDRDKHQFSSWSH